MRLLLLVLLAPVIGCVTLSTPMSAATLRDGEVQVAFSPSVVHSPGIFQDGARPLYASGEFAFRFAVTDRNEVGVKLFTLGGSALTRHALYRSDSEDSDFNLSIEPQLTAYKQISFAGGDRWVVVPQISAYLGWRLAGHEVMVAPRVTGFIFLEGVGAKHLPYVGGAATYSLQVHDALRAGAYLSYMHPVVRAAGFQDAPVVQGGPMLSWSFRR